MNWAHRMTGSANYAAAATTGTGNMTFGAATAVKVYEYAKRTVIGDAGDRATIGLSFASETSIPIRARYWPVGVSSSDVTKALTIVSKETQSTLDGSYSFYVYDVE